MRFLHLVSLAVCALCALQASSAAWSQQLLLAEIVSPLPWRYEALAEEVFSCSPAASLGVAMATPAPEYVEDMGPEQIADMVKAIAREFRVDPNLALAFIQVESNFDVTAKSHKNAQGLMQLIPATAARFKVTHPFDPVQNIRGGLAYLRWLLAYFEGDVALVAAAYNAGEGAVNRHRGVPPYIETLGYVSKILKASRMVSHPFDASVARASPHLRLIRDPRLLMRGGV